MNALLLFLTLCTAIHTNTTYTQDVYYSCQYMCINCLELFNTYVELKKHQIDSADCGCACRGIIVDGIVIDIVIDNGN